MLLIWSDVNDKKVVANISGQKTLSHNMFTYSNLAITITYCSITTHFIKTAKLTLLVFEGMKSSFLMA